MAHEHTISCLEEGPSGGSLICKVTGQEASTDPKSADNVTRALRKWNEALHRITFNRYQRQVPYGEMHRAALDAGFKVKNEDEAPFMLLGHDSKADVEYIHPAAPRKTYYLHLTWHRMPSGNFESVAYAN